MKPTITFLVIALSLNCSPEEKKEKAGEVATWATYKINQIEGRTTAAIRVTKDTIMNVKIDSLTTRNQRTMYTFYLVPFTDTLRKLDTILKRNVPQFDSTGRPILQTLMYPIEKEHILVDYHLDAELIKIKPNADNKK